MTTNPVNELEKQIAELNRKKNKVERIRELYPDLQTHRDRWSRERYQSKAVLTQATHIELRHSCGCCNDSPLLAMPYVKVGDEQVYSDPIQIYIGERAYAGGDEWDPDWREKLQALGIPAVAIESIADQEDVRTYEEREAAYDNE